MKFHPLMSPTIPVSVAAGLLVAGLSACSQTPPKVAEAPKETATTRVGITEEAQKALLQAEADVLNARERFALWTTAEAALKQAREAANGGDSAGIIRHAAFATDQARKGLDQLAYPSTELK